MRLLFIGDLIGKPGREALAKAQEQLDFSIYDVVIANCENAAGGYGLTANVAQSLFQLGIHALTSGNHIWDKKDVISYLKKEERILRPANYPAATPGFGSYVYEINGYSIGVISLLGRVFLKSLDCPFEIGQKIAQEIRQQTPYILVDFHAEATAEKAALAYYLDGQVSAVVGTHTHVQTADERVLSQGTAYISDVGMTGSVDGVIGYEAEKAVYRFVSQMPARLKPAEGRLMINAVDITINDNGLAEKIQRINKIVSLGDES